MSRETFNINTIVRAGAGAGKTTRLISTIVDFCNEFRSEHKRFPRIIVCTFTRKATQELRERLMQQAIKSGDWDFVRFVTSSQLHVSTIHGVLLKFLSHFGYRLGLDPRFRFVDDTAALQAAKKIVRDIFISDELNENDRERILQNFDFKTLADFGRKHFEFSMYHNHSKMHDAESLRSILEEEIKLAKEKVQRSLLNLEPHLGEKPIVQEISNWLGILRKVLDSGQIDIESLRNHLEEMPNFRKNTKNPPVYEDILTDIRDFKAALKENWLSPTYDLNTFGELEKSLAAVGKFLNLFKRKYFDFKVTSGELQISDLEVLALELIRSHPDTAQLFSLDWDYWMVDEYQDTSPIQVELLRHLQGNRCAFTVGDPQQSIYLFRGARCEVFAAKEEELKNKNGKLDTLGKNYRSRPALVHFFNDVFAKMGGQFFPAEAACPESSLLFSDVRICWRAEENESSVVVSEVNRLLNKGVSANDICILARTHKSLNLAAKQLTGAGISCLVHSAGGFYERREILDALALLRFLLNPHDNINFFELIRSPWFYISDQKILEFFAAKKGKMFSFWSEVQDHPEFASLKNHLDRREILSITEIFRRVLVEVGFFDYSHVLDITGRREANLWKLVNDLEQASRQPGFSFLDFSRQKVHEINLEVKEDQDAVSARESHRVNLMTVHQSKGLEFEHVIVLDIDEKPKGDNRSRWSFDEENGRVSFPVFFSGETKKTLGDIHCQKVNEQREQEEFARVFYVAVTRAVQSLVLIGREIASDSSWQNRLGLNLTPGEFSEKNYKYLVSMGPWAVNGVLKTSGLNNGNELKPVSAIKGSKPAIAKYSVSQLVKGEAEKASGSKYRKTSVLEGLEFSNRGILMHRILESVKYQGLDAGIEAAGSFFPKNGDEIKEALRWVFALKTPDFSEIFRSGSAEWGFQFVEDNKIIDGQIDLWGKVKGEVWVVDYKTGSSRFLKKAFAQMQWYAKALRKFGVTEDINLAVIFPFEQKIEVQKV